MRILVVIVSVINAVDLAAATGEEYFQTRCALCHGADGTGTDRATSILPILSAREPNELKTIITEGVSAKGMPAFAIPDSELASLITYLKTLAASVASAVTDPRAPRPQPGTIPLVDGGSLTGTIMNVSGFDAQVRTPDGQIHLLRRESDTYREVSIEPYRD